MTDSTQEYIPFTPEEGFAPSFVTDKKTREKILTGVIPDLTAREAKGAGGKPRYRACGRKCGREGVMAPLRTLPEHGGFCSRTSSRDRQSPPYPGPKEACPQFESGFYPLFADKKAVLHLFLVDNGEKRKRFWGS